MMRFELLDVVLAGWVVCGRAARWARTKEREK